MSSPSFKSLLISFHWFVPQPNLFVVFLLLFLYLYAFVCCAISQLLGVIFGRFEHGFRVLKQVCVDLNDMLYRIRFFIFIFCGVSDCGSTGNVVEVL